MDLTAVKRWTIILLGILSAILIASAATRVAVHIAGLTGWPAFVGSFVVYAIVFFSLIALYEKVFGVGFFRFAID